MAITVNWPIKVINIPRIDMELLQTTPTEIRELDLNEFRLILKDLEDNEQGINWPKTHNHNAPFDLGGLTLSRTLEIVNEYTITFENGQYAVNLAGANSNIGDRVNVNQVSIRSFNSAGLVTAAAIEYASFGDGVTVDVTSDVSGTIYPRGTKEKPVNNLTDAILIAESRGFDTLFISKSMTLNAGTNIEDYNIIGRSAANTHITIDSSAICNNISIEKCNISGTLDGGSSINECSVGDLTYVNGHIHNSGLYGTIVLDGNEEAIFVDCYTSDQDSPPIIDMGGSGQDLAMPNYSGIVTIKNLSSASEEIGIGLDAGMVILEDTVTAGTIIVSGIGLLLDNSTGTTTVNTEGLINKTTISEAIWDESISDHVIPNTTGHEALLNAYDGFVHIHQDGGSGTSYPYGTEGTPVGNIADGITIANLYNIKKLYIEGSIVIGAGDDISDFTLIAHRSLGNVVTVNSGAITNKTYFENLTVSGTMNGNVRYTTSVLGVITNFDGGAKNCLITANITITGNGSNYFTDCDVYTTNSSSYKSLDVNGKALNLIRCRGNYEIANKTNSDTLSIDLVGGRIHITDTCISGIIEINGIAEIVDDSAIGCEVEINSMSHDAISENVWDENTANHIIPGTTGEILESIAYTQAYVFIDTELVENGNGRSESPFNNVSDAVDFCEIRGWRRLIFLSDATLERTLKNFIIDGVGLPTIDLNGQNIDKSEFYKVKLFGDQVGSIIAREVVLMGGMTGVSGIYRESAITGNIALADNALTSLSSIVTVHVTPTEPYYTIDMGDTNTNVILNIRKMSGYIGVLNCNTSTKLATIGFSSGTCELNNTNTDGIIELSGIPDTAVTDNSAGSTVTIEGIFPGAQTITDAVWNELMSGHEGAGSFGLIISDMVKLLGFKITKSGDIITIYESDGNTVWRTYNVADGGRIQT